MGKYVEYDPEDPALQARILDSIRRASPDGKTAPHGRQWEHDREEGIPGYDYVIYIWGGWRKAMVAAGLELLPLGRRKVQR